MCTNSANVSHQSSIPSPNTHTQSCAENTYGVTLRTIKSFSIPPPILGCGGRGSLLLINLYIVWALLHRWRQNIGSPRPWMKDQLRRLYFWVAKAANFNLAAAGSR